MKNRSAPKSLGKFESVASLSDAFKVTHDTELDAQGVSWSVRGGGAAGYRVTNRPLQPRLVYRTTQAGINPSPLNDFILHNSKRRGDVLLITEEDYLDTDETPPGGCRGQGKFETWRINAGGRVTPIDTWQTEANELAFSGGSKAPLTVNCSSHWFEQKSGIAAVGWYEQGVRFLDTRSPGNIRQVGYYLPANGSTWAAYWSPTDPSGQIVYTADAYRGVDVLRIDGGGQSATAKTAPTPDEWYGTLTTAYAPSDAWGWSCVINLGGTAPGGSTGSSAIRSASKRSS